MSETANVDAWAGYEDATPDPVECGWCGEMRICRYVSDPFLSEVYQEHHLAYFCEPCYDNRHDEV